MKKRVKAMLQVHTPKQAGHQGSRAGLVLLRKPTRRGSCAREAWRVRRFSGEEDDARARPSQSGRSLLQLHQAMLNCSQS